MVSLVDQKGSIKVTEIIERLNVSDMTVRRDLTELEA
ncbi:DeoR family transcriptional regulator, partial [Enterococcus faecalis]